jgi:hypothetical protein
LHLRFNFHLLLVKALLLAGAFMLQPAQAITPISSATATFNFSDVSTTELLTALVSMSVGTPFDLNPDDQL